MITKTVKFYTEQWICKCGKEWPEMVNNCPCGEVQPKEWTEGMWTEGEFVWEFPGEYEVCGTCSGTGSTYLGWPSNQQPAFTMEDFHREGPDFYEDYMTGAYDKCCPECNGERVVAVIDEKHLSKIDEEIFEAWGYHLKCEYDYQAEVEAERRYLYGPNY